MTLQLSLVSQISDLVDQIRNAETQEGTWAASMAVDYLERMKNVIESGKDLKTIDPHEKIFGGVAKTVGDDWNWSNSPLGKSFWDILNAFEALCSVETDPAS